MRDYKFSEIPYDDFQRFATSLISIKENKKIRCNSMTHDGGIDFYDLEGTIIGQVKRTNNNFSNLKSSLKKEVERVNELKPNRYILVTATPCSKQNKEELINMFNGYLKYEDILDENEINQLLEEPKYHKLEIEYLKLLVPNTFVLAHFLKQVEYNHIYNQTEIELNDIKKDQKIFSVTEPFDQALNKLEQEHTIIISGEPGVGKTILGRMLCAYIINANPDIEFIKVKTIEELYQIHNKESNQLYFFDDFFGDIKYNFQIDTNKQNSLISFINYIKERDNKWLIITTREYVLQDGLNLNKKEKNKFLPYKFNLNLEDISKTSKFNILYNHLIKTDLSWEHLKIILDYWKNIVNNDNYTPRLIETFLEQYDNYKTYDDIDFINEFLCYLYEPFDYWKEILTEQPFELIILFIIIALNDEKMSVEVLNNRFNYIVNKKHLEKEIILPFEEYIKKMEDTFAITNIYENKLYIEFKNPSYKDFITDYLENNIHRYISYIYDEILTLKEMINLWNIINKKYELYKDLKEVKQLDNNLLLRLIEEPEDYQLSLINLAESTNFNYETKIKKLLISKTIEFIENAEYLMYDDYDSYEAIFPLLSIMKDKYDFSEHIWELLLIVTFDSSHINEFEYLISLKNTYPEIYKTYYKEYKTDIRKQLHCHSINSAYYYKKTNDEIGIDIFVHQELPRIYEELNIKIPNKLQEKLNKIEEEIYKSEESKKKVENLSKFKYNNKGIQKEEDLSLIEDKIVQLTGESNRISDINKFLKENNISPKVKKLINKIDDDCEEITLLNSLVQSKNTLLLLCEYLETGKKCSNTIEFFDNFTSYISDKNNLSEEDYFNISGLGFILLKNNKAIFTLEELLNMKDIPLTKEKLEYLLNTSFFIKRDKWYHFVHPIIQLYLALTETKKMKFDINIKYFLNLTWKNDQLWNKIDYYNYDEVTIYRLISLLYPEKWNNLVKEEFQELLSKIDTKDEISVAKSILKYFKIKLSYNYYATSCNFDNPLLHNIIRMYFDKEILQLFVLNPYEHTEEMIKFYEKYTGETEDTTLYINKHLNNKKFINILIENNIIEELNNIYNKIKEYNEEKVLV